MKQVKTVKIPVHSLIDLITNSSTEIFVDSTNSVEPCKDLLNEFLSLMGSDKTCDEVFEVTLEDDDNNLTSWFEYNFEYDIDEEVYKKYKEKYHLGESNDWKVNDAKLKVLMDDYKAGKCDDIEVEEYHIQKHLLVKCKDEKYANIPKLLNDFLYSPEHYEYSTG